MLLAGTHAASITFTNNYVQAPWKGRFWARTLCSTDSTGKFSCATAECSSGQVSCNGNGAVSPASLAEINITDNSGMDYFDVSNVDGFNLTVSVATQGGTGECKASSCPANVNATCLAELQITGSNGSPQYCCTGSYSTPQTCPPTNYSRFFETQCPQAYS
ncbi:hypothetical protein ACB098_09G038500 [Castanea mollissima]